MSENTTPRVPVRRCAGCGKRAPKTELLRIVAAGGTAVPDAGGKAQSRGTYLCRNAGCLKKAVKGGRIAAALKCTVDEEVLKAALLPAESSAEK